MKRLGGGAGAGAGAATMAMTMATAGGLTTPLHASLSPRSLEEERAFMIRSLSAKSGLDALAASASAAATTTSEPECLVCLEPFSATRVSANSLCACGVNRYKIHVDCLGKWRPTTCPTCDEELFWEEPTLSVATA